MARSTSWGYTNTTPSTNASLTIYQVGEHSNYTAGSKDPTVPSDKYTPNMEQSDRKNNRCYLSNLTSGLDQPEIISLQSRTCSITADQAKCAYPGPSKGGVQYGVELRDILRVTDPSGLGTTNIVDEPVVMWLAIRHSTSNAWKNADISALLGRMLGALYDETNQKWRFEDLMRNNTKPNND